MMKPISYLLLFDSFALSDSNISIRYLWLFMSLSLCLSNYLRVFHSIKQQIVSFVAGFLPKSSRYYVVKVS